MGWRVDFGEVAKSPKSTVVGLCVLALAAERGVHFDATGHLAMSARDWFDLGCGALTAFVSGLSSDAGQVKMAAQSGRTSPGLGTDGHGGGQENL